MKTKPSMTPLDDALLASVDLPDLAHRGIECHTAIRPDHQWVKAFTAIEGARRASAQSEETLQQLETHYFGPEVGALRRFIEQRTLANIRPVSEFLDLGCGGPWWKDGYWSIPKKVTGVEVDWAALVKVREAFPDAARYRLIFAPYGLTELPDESFDLVLSSSVVGYLLPSIARLHISEASRLTRRGGLALFARVKAQNIWSLVERQRLRETAPGIFDCTYSTKELRRELEEAGFAIEDCRSIGLRLPLPWKTIQRLYRFSGMRMMDGLVNSASSLLAIHHMVVARKK